MQRLCRLPSPSLFWPYSAAVSGAQAWEQGIIGEGAVPRGSGMPDPLSQQLGSQKFFFGDAPASLDTFVFGYLALLPNGKLQAHLRGSHNLCAYCTHVLSLCFPWDGAEVPSPRQTPVGPETEGEPYQRRNQILPMLVALTAMVG